MLKKLSDHIRHVSCAELPEGTLPIELITPTLAMQIKQNLMRRRSSVCVLLKDDLSGLEFINSRNDKYICRRSHLLIGTYSYNADLSSISSDIDEILTKLIESNYVAN